MRSRFLAILLLLSLSLGLFSACRKSEIVALYFAVTPGDGVSFDPQIAGGGLPETVVRNVYEGLVYVNENGEVEPGVAKSWSVSPDGLTYTFDLRSDAVWHYTRTAKAALEEKLGEVPDDRVTADDFVFALRRAVDPATGCEGSRLLSNIENAPEIGRGEKQPPALGVKALGDHRLEITLLRPQNDFLEILGEPLCMPCKRAVFDAAGGRYGLFIRCIASNGPFFMTRFDLDEGSARLEKSPDYVGDHRAKADVVWLYDKVDASLLAQNLKEKNFSGAVGDAILLSSLPERKFTAVRTADVLRGFLLNPACEALKSYYFRRAFCAATTLETLLQSEEEEAAPGFAPGVFSALEPPLSGLVDPEAAATLLKTGLQDLGQDSVSVTILCEARFELSMRRLLQDFQKALGLGLALRIETVEDAERLRSRVRAGDFEIAFYPVRAERFSPAGYFELFSSDVPNALVSLEDAPLCAAVNALRFSLSPSKTAFETAQDALLDAAVLYPAWQEDSLFIVRKDVVGVRVLPGVNRLYFYNAAFSG